MKANEVIRMRRKELGMTLKEAANAVGAGKGSDDVSKALGVSQPTVSTWMTAKKVPRMETIDALCAYLNCKRTDLLEEHNATPLEDERRQLVRLAMTADIENVKTALILLSALENKK